MRNPFRRVRVVEEHRCGSCGDRELKIYTTTAAEYWLKQNWSMIIAFQLFIGFSVGFKLYQLMRGTNNTFRGVFAGLVAFAISVLVAQVCLTYVPYLIVIQVVICLLTAGVSFYKTYKEFGWL